MNEAIVDIKMSDISPQLLEVKDIPILSYTPKSGDVLLIHLEVGNLPRAKAEEFVNNQVALFRKCIPNQQVKIIGLPMRDGLKTELEVVREITNE